eukprot:5706515-Amphidinium_carterae.1
MAHHVRAEHHVRVQDTDPMILFSSNANNSGRPSSGQVQTRRASQSMKKGLDILRASSRT